MVEAAVARDGKGRDGRRGSQAVARIGSVNVSVEALLADDFVVNGKREKRYRDARLSLDAPLKIGRQQHHRPMAMCGLIDRGDGTRTLNAAGRLSTNFNGFNLTTQVDWQPGAWARSQPATTGSRSG